MKPFSGGVIERRASSKKYSGDPDVVPIPRGSVARPGEVGDLYPKRGLTAEEQAYIQALQQQLNTNLPALRCSPYRRSTSRW
jgi:hypothetical protein